MSHIPNYEDQPSSSSISCCNHPGGVPSPIELTYPRSRLMQSPFGKNYTLYDKTGTMPCNMVLTATNGNIRAMLPCTAMLVCSCKGFKLEFYKPGQLHPAILRIQKDDSKAVAPGQSPLMYGSLPGLCCTLLVPHDGWFRPQVTPGQCSNYEILIPVLDVQTTQQAV
jgi:hypothetical protein